MKQTLHYLLFGIPILPSLVFFNKTVWLLSGVSLLSLFKENAFPYGKCDSLDCVKSVHIRSFFWSDYRKIQTRKISVFIEHFSRSVTSNKIALSCAFHVAQAYSEPYQTSNMELFAKIGDGNSKNSISYVWQGLWMCLRTSNERFYGKITFFFCPSII